MIHVFHLQLLTLILIFMNQIWRDSKSQVNGTHVPEMMNALVNILVSKASLKIQEKKVAFKAAGEQNIAKAVELGNKGMRHIRSFAQHR